MHADARNQGGAEGEQRCDAAPGEGRQKASADDGGEMIDADDGMTDPGQKPLQERHRRRAAHGVMGVGRRLHGQAGDANTGREPGDRRHHRFLRRRGSPARPDSMPPDEARCREGVGCA